MLEELVEDDLRDGLALEVDLDPHAGAIRVILDVRDLAEHLVVDEVGDLLDARPMSPPFFTPYGSSVTMIAFFPRGAPRRALARA